MSVQMDERVAAALREVLVAQADDADSPRRWMTGPKRWVAGAGAATILAAAGTGIAYATGAFETEPGGHVATALAAPVTVTRTGTQIVELGPQPAAATAITMSFACLTAGTFTFADGAQVRCSTRADTHSPALYTMSIAPGTDRTTIAATPGARWRLTATYASVITTAWDINASGQTYGVENQHGSPDLIAVIATNRRNGYVYANQLNRSPKTLAGALASNNAPPRTLTAYESDGKTPIGKFIVGR